MSGLLPTPGHALLVARMELRRQWRRQRTRGTVQLVALGVLGLFLAAGSLAAGFGGYLAGRALRAGDVADPVGVGRYVVAAVSVFVFFVVAFRAVTESGRVDEPSGMLTTVPHRDVVGGLLGAEAATTALLFGVPALSGTLGLALGTRSAATLVLAGAALVAVGTVAVATGYAAGLAVRNLLARSTVVARHRIALGALVFLAYMGLVLTNSLGSALEPVVAASRRTPVGWFADLGLLAVVGDASAVRAAAALAVTPLVLAGLVAVSVRLAGLLWYADPVEAGSRASTSWLGDGRLSAGWLPRPTAQVAVKCWLRARRAPVQVLFVAYPLFLLVGPVSQAVETGEVPATLAATVALYGAWATGAAFTLNPLGNEGPVLPTTLTSGASSREFVGGLVLAGGVVGVPATAALTLAVGLVGPQTVAGAVVLAAVGAGLALAATGVAVGVGTAFPRFDAVRVVRSRKAVVPSLVGFAAYSLVLVLVALPGLASQVPGVVEAVGPAGGAGVATVLGPVTTLVLAGLAGYLGFRYAARELERYTL